MRTVTLSVRTIRDMDNKVRAIKGVRGLSNIGLKEAKELVERVTPGNNEVIKLRHDILEPRYTEYLDLVKSSGITVHTSRHDDKMRMAVGDEIRKLVTFTTMTGQYDIGKALLDVLETYCPEPAEEYRNEADDEA